MRRELNGRLDKMVSTDLFAAEQKRVDGRFRDLGDDLKEASEKSASLEKSLAHEVSERKQAETTAARSALEQQKALEDQRGKNRWTLFGIIAGPFVVGVVGFILGGGLAVVR
ncbi:hypothetical protein MN032_11175 [Agromyces atrinae]|uniref:hypothetical protein n=1 Tax=Agromyces atrinae TaxID=592376 RepID=UPI001F56DBC9|nr:hypothetical protein [Agromyces atrinae]MCI2958260.1 hypothetical protein [Agromyces atrinae]